MQVLNGRPQTSGTTQALRCVRLVGGHSAYAAGLSGVIVKKREEFFPDASVLDFSRGRCDQHLS